MPHASLKLKPGIDTNQTPALNEAGISSGNLIRFIYDRTLGALVQKLGGWTKFYPNTMPAIVRALWAWEDTEAVSHLAYGTQNIVTSAQLGVITNGNSSNITPRYASDDITVAASSTSGSSYIVITDTTTTGITNYDSVYIATQIAIGGVVLFGQYACDPNGYINATSYTIQALDVLGNPLAATSTSTSPTLPLFSVTIIPTPQSNVTVTFPNHGYSVGDTFPVLLPTTVGGVVFYGNYSLIY